MINIAGIRFRIHPLFVLILMVSAATGAFLEIVTLFGIVLIHELGHVAAMLIFGWRIRTVQLLPFGGVAETDEGAAAPAWQEAIVALAGPLQNVWMIGLSAAFAALGIWDDEWAAYFIRANLAIALFNLLPVLPLDGGRLLLAFLSLQLHYYRTLWLTTWFSLLSSAAVLACAAYMWLTSGQPPLNLIVIAVFLLYSNYYHYRSLPFHFFRFLLNRELRLKRWIEQGVLARPILTTESRLMRDLVRLYMRESIHMVYVLNERGEIGAVVPEQKLTAAYLNGKPGSAVSELFR